MKRVMPLFLVLLLAWAGAAFAQEEPAQGEVAGISQGQFAILLLKAAANYRDELPTEAEALELVKGYEMVPEDWAVADVLTHGELGEVLGQLGVVYVPADPSKPVSQPFAEAILRRELGPLRDYYYRRLGHDITIDNLLDDGVRPAVSPSSFD